MDQFWRADDGWITSGEQDLGGLILVSRGVAFLDSAQGLDVASKGTHALRHTLATGMVCQGASLKEVADVLRHRNLDTTVIYARVDLPALKSVAPPWPEVR